MNGKKVWEFTLNGYRDEYLDTQENFPQYLQWLVVQWHIDFKCDPQGLHQVLKRIKQKVGYEKH